MKPLVTWGWPQSLVCVVLFVTVCSCANLSWDHLLVKRNNCDFERLKCIKSPELLCAPGEDCISVKDSFSLTDGLLCEPECIVSPTNSTNTTKELPDIIIDPNGTEPQSLNSSYCHKNFFCQNGGNCTERYFMGFGEMPSCDCPSGWQGDFCQEECSLNCHGNGRCLRFNGTQRCNCHINYSPPYCQFLKTTVAPTAVSAGHENDTIYIPVLVCIISVLILLFGYFLLLRLRGRSLFVTKLFHYLQPYEDDDGKQFDAFISFRSTNMDYSQSEDEKFVIRVLQPILENNFQYKVCVHYRDFPPGETIANNIMWAVENSRRTILILSPLYVGSEWARLEYQKAQQEMLQLRHKIIPVIFDDISDTHIEDPTLKHILSSVTYINYPSVSDESVHTKFWQMLKLALPKKRSVCMDTARTDVSERCPSTIINPRLVSQQSSQSSEIRNNSPVDNHKINISEETFSKYNGFAHINDLDNNRVYNDKTINKSKEIKNNAEKYIVKLESVS